MKKKKLLMIFLYSFRLSASAFGGGYVLISLMRRIYAEKLGWLTEEEMLDVTAISQSAPGASAVNAAVLVGYKLNGAAGAALAVAGTILPPLIIMSVIAALYTSFSENEFISKLMTGMQCGVAAVILEAVLGMTKSALKSRTPLYSVIFVAALALTLIGKVSAVYVILLAAIVGAMDSAIRSQTLLHRQRGHVK